MLTAEVAMPRQSAPGDPPVAGRPWGRPPQEYSPAEWHLLTRLPGQAIVVATLLVRATATRPGIGSGLAGLEGIAAGRAFDSDLVRAVVAGIYAESDSGRQDGPQATDRATAEAEVFAACARAVRLLAERADPADSAAYRQWVQSIAARVCRAARPGGLTPLDGVPGGSAERRFLDELGSALGLV